MSAIVGSKVATDLAPDTNQKLVQNIFLYLALSCLLASDKQLGAGMRNHLVFYVTMG